MTPLAAPALAAPNYSAIAISAVVSIAVFWTGYALNRAASRRERQRKVIEDWLRELGSWTDKFADPSSKPDYNYNTLTSRHVIELSLQRKHRYLAWWMHEMAVAIINRRKASSKSIELRQTCADDLNGLLNETGEYLLKWHHKELKSSDFHFPYQLRAKARSMGIQADEYAHSINLDPYLAPVRMDAARKWTFLKLLLDPTQGKKTLAALEGFIGKHYVGIALIVTIFLRLLYGIRLLRAQMNLHRSNRRLNRLKRKLEDLCELEESSVQ
ncbi:hypothetical protein [Arthrobacter sp. zg-Y769]|uniref:hypothetical protein n=1 Tax=Arthrobacter sp. zg-Y769 TaxID=2894191 RepID=UPI001E28CE0B|nr:hypothetical protein [Arthrobacter sp. zg-Y769]MCC9204971.1 hypothetical protein [Arthrobacter sp. zg-Y769]